MKENPGLFIWLANRLRKLFSRRPPPPPFEDSSRNVFDGLVEFLPIAEVDLRNMGRTQLADSLGSYSRYFLNLHRQGFVAFLTPDQGEELSKLLTKVSYEYKTASVPRPYRAQLANLVQIAKYLALEALNVNMHGKIRKKTLSDFLDLLSPKDRPAPAPPPTLEQPKQPPAPEPKPEVATTRALPKPFKAPPPGTEATTTQQQEAIRKAFQPERPTPPPTSLIPPSLDFSDSTHLFTLKEYLIELLPAIQEDLRVGYFRANHGDIRQIIAAAVPPFIDALSSDGPTDGLLSQRVTFLEKLAEIYANEIRAHPKYPNVFFSSAIEKYRTVKYLAHKAQYGSLNTSITQGDINFFNSTLTIP